MFHVQHYELFPHTHAFSFIFILLITRRKRLNDVTFSQGIKNSHIKKGQLMGSVPETLSRDIQSCLVICIFLYDEKGFHLKVVEGVVQFVHWNRLETANQLSHHVIHCA